MIGLGIFIVGTIAGYLGSLLDGGGSLLSFGPWSLILGTVGSFAGIWVGYKAGQYFGL